MTTPINHRCECHHRPTYISLYRGDDSDFAGNQEVFIELDTELDLTGCTAHFKYMGMFQNFETIPEDRKLRLVFPREQTKEMPIGAWDAELWLEDASGKRRTVSNRIHILVTNSVSEAYCGEDPQAIKASIGNKFDYNNAYNKPTLNGVVIEGNKTSRDYHIEGGGGGGTDDYNELYNKPKINGVELSGDKSSADLGLQDVLPREGSAYNILVSAAHDAETAEIAESAGRAFTDGEGNNFQNTYATKSEVDDKLANMVSKDDVVPVGDGTEVIARIGGKEIKAPAGGGGGGTVTKVAGVGPNADGNVPLTAGDINALEVHDEGGRRSVYISADDENEARLFINSVGDAQAHLTVAGEPGTPGLVSIGATEGAVGDLRVGGNSGTISVGWNDLTGVEIDSVNGTGAIRVFGETSSITKDGKEVATKEQLDTAKAELNSRIDAIERSSNPNMTVVGNPVFKEGSVSGFSASDYMVFPSQVSVGQSSVEFYLSFRTGTVGAAQQNILDSDKGLAFAIRNGRFVTAISVNGTAWHGEDEGDTVRSESAYEIKMTFTYEGGSYLVRTFVKENGAWRQMGTGISANAPVHATTTYWGGANPQTTNHIFLGSINLNECRMVFDGNEVWSGYDVLARNLVTYDQTKPISEQLNTAEKIVGVVQDAVSLNNRFLVDGTTAAIQTRESEDAEWSDEIRLDKGYDALQGTTMVKLDKSVQTVTVDGGTLEVIFPDSVDGTVRDLCLYVNNTPGIDVCTVVFPDGTYYGADGWDAAAQKGGITGYYFSEIPGNGWRVSREELKQFTKGA